MTIAEGARGQRGGCWGAEGAGGRPRAQRVGLRGARAAAPSSQRPELHARGPWHPRGDSPGRENTQIASAFLSLNPCCAW